MTEKELAEKRRKAGCEADISLILRSLGKSPVRRDGRLVHPEYPDLVITGQTSWLRESGLFGFFGSYARGNAIHYLIEYEKMNMEPALDTICALTAPHLLSTQPIPLLRPRERLEGIERRLAVEKILADVLSGPADDDSGDRPHIGDLVDYPKQWPEPDDSEEGQEKARETVERLDGVDRRVMNYLFAHGRAFVGKGRYGRYLVFPGPRADGEPGFFYIRTLLSTRPLECRPLAPFRPFSRFAWHAGSDGAVLRIFETPVDAASYMSLVLAVSDDMAKVENMQMMALSTSEILPLLTYLKRSDARELHLCMNRTDNGTRCGEMIKSRLADVYEIFSEMPENGFATWKAQARAYRMKGNLNNDRGG